MKLPDVKQLARNARVLAVKRSPEILTGIGIGGMITTTVLAVRATPKALTLIEEAKKENKEDEFSNIDTVKACWKVYIPAAVTGTLSVACLIGASSVNYKRNAALATAYTLSETALKEYKDKVVEVVGEKKAQDVKDAVAKERIKNKPVSNSEVIVTDKGTTLCYDSVSGRYFYSDMNTLKSIENKLNKSLYMDNYISMNEMYSEIGIPTNEMGDILGWNVYDGFVEFEFSTQLSEDGRPCLVIDYNKAPKYDYYL